MKFNEKLVQLRKQHGFSQETLADILGVSRQAVSKWETAVTQPEMSNILRLCEIFKVSPNELLCCGDELLEAREETELSETDKADAPGDELSKNRRHENHKGWLTSLTTIIIVGMAFWGIVACLDHSSNAMLKEKERQWLSERFSVEGYDISFVENVTKYSKRLRIIFTPNIHREDYQYKIVVTDDTGFTSQYDAHPSGEGGVYTGTFLVSGGREYIVTVSVMVGEYTYSDALIKIRSVSESSYGWEKIDD